MSISMCENDGVPSVMHDVRRRAAASATRSDHAIVPAAVHALEQLLGARLLERHPRRRAPPSSALGVVVDADHAQPAVGEESASGRPTRPQPMTATS